MKNSELRALSLDELNKKLIIEKENLDKLVFSHAVTPIENPIDAVIAQPMARKYSINCAFKSSPIFVILSFINLVFDTLLIYPENC